MSLALLLDAHGTLLRLRPPAPRLRALLARRHGIVRTEAETARAMGAEIAFYRAHMHGAPDAAAVDALRWRCGEIVRDELGLHELDVETVTRLLLEALVFRPYSDVRPLLAWARAAGVAVVVASNWDASLPVTLERIGLAEGLRGVVTSASVGAAKPDPAVLRAALTIAGAPPQAAVHVGDSVAEDVEGARAAGVRPILLARDGGTGPPGVETIETLDALPSLLTRAGAP